MGYITTSKRYENVINRCLSDSHAASCVYVPTVILHHPDDGYRLSPRIVKRFYIDQEFTTRYTDSIVISVEITLDEFKELTKHLKNLKCTIKLEAYSSVLQRKLFNVEPIIFDSLTVVSDEIVINQLMNANVNKTASDVSNPDTPEKAEARITYPLFLINSKMYDARQIQINSVLTNVTVEQVLYWSANQFGFDLANIYPPDNPTVYKNFIIPPMKDISTLYGYIQSRYGVYKDGCGYYATDDCLDIYPIFATDTTRVVNKGTIHLVHIAEGSYKGLAKYHHRYDDDVYILSNTNMDRKSMNTRKMDEEGNTHSFAMVDGRHDNSVVVGKNGTVTRDKTVIQTIDMNANSQPKTNAQIYKFDGYTNNVFKETTKMFAANSTVMRLGWAMAEPKLLKPGQLVMYHYDNDGGDYQVKRGRVLSAVYNAAFVNLPDGTNFGMTFGCELNLFLEPDTVTNGADTTIGG